MRGRFVLLFILLSFGLKAEEIKREKGDSLFVMFWNLENLFYYIDNQSDSLKIRDFSPRGVKHWTKKRFYTKINAISKSIFYVAEKYKRQPDIIGFCEIENKKVLNKLLYETLLKKTDYKIIHYDSYDHRGIDVALFYRSSKLKYISSKTCHVIAKQKDFTFLKKDSLLHTRDILLSEFEDNTQRKIQISVNHHPSKFGGSQSQWKREAAVLRLREIYDSLYIKNLSQNSVFIAMGDFNDTPQQQIYKHLTNKDPALHNYALNLHKKGEGSIRFNGKWDLIDLFFVGSLSNKDFNEKSARMQILKIPYLMMWDNVYTGFKPYRTYLGPRYIGGVSDHCPVVLFMK